MNIYKVKFTVKCPSDGDLITYKLCIYSASMIMAEQIKTATALIKSGYHEKIADALHNDFGG